MPDPYREPTENEPEAVKELKGMPSLPEAKEQPVAPEKPPIEPSQEQAPPPSPASVSSPSPSPPPPAKTPASADPEKDRQLKMLIDLAFQQGIEKAIEAVNSTGDAYLVDKFHDTLVDELRQQLIEKGKLKEI